MKCYANRVNTRLLSIPQSSPVTESVTGAEYRVLPGQSDDQTDAAQEFKFVTQLSFSGGLTGPTARIVIQGSGLDGVGWMDLLVGTTQTATGTYTEGMDSTVVGLLPWIRAVLQLAGEEAPSVSALVELVSTGPFQLSSS